MRSLANLHTPLLAFGTLLVTACAGAGMGDQPPVSDDGYLLREPILDSIAPTQVALGDTVTIFGSDFIDPQHGDMALLLDGAYLDSAGSEHPFTGEIQVDVVNGSVAEFKFEEIFFHPSRDKIGTWRGTAMLVNRMAPMDDVASEDEMWSAEQEVSIQVQPSIKMERLRSADASNCAPVTPGTNMQNNIEIGFKALGLGEATPSNPWTVRMHFTAPDVSVQYIIPGSLSFWPIDGHVDPSKATDAEPGNHEIEFQLDQGSTVILDPSRREHVVEVSPAVQIGQNYYDEVMLGRLMAGDVEFNSKNTVNFLIEIVTADGRTLRRVASMDIWAAFEVGYWNGVERVVERSVPYATSGCVPGGLVGREFTYSEGKSETRTTSVGVRWDASTASTLGFSITGGTGVASPVSFQVGVEASNTWTQSFGIDENVSVSSESHNNQSLNIHLLPTYYGMSYRQIERLERSVEVVYHNDCGMSGVVGEAVMTNWNFGFDVTQAQVCPPPSNLPPACQENCSQ